MNLTIWIDKQLRDLENENLFRRYFRDRNVEEIEGHFYLINMDEGIDLVLSPSYCIQSIHLFAESIKTSGYKGEVPLKLNFSMAQDSVRRQLGNPIKGGGEYRDIWGDVPLWDKYFFDGYTLHIQYTSDKFGIELITIGSLSLEDYFNVGLQ